MNKTIYISAIIFLSLIFALSSCDSPTNTAIFKTNEVDFNDINQTPGFVWFTPRYNEYVCDSNIILQIKSAIKPEHNFYFYAMPSCDCENYQDIFPYSIKILHKAGISKEQFKMIVLKDKNADHPYKNIVHLKDLPEIFLIKNNISVYSIGDTVKQRMNDTSVDYKKALLELVILEAIQANQ